MTIESLELPPRAPDGRRVISHVCHAPHQTMSRTSSPAGFVSGHSMVCLWIEPEISSAPNMERGDYDVRRSDGQRGLLGITDSRQRQMTCRTTKLSATTRLIESDFSRAVGHGRGEQGAPVGSESQLAGSLLAESEDGREGLVDAPLLVWADSAHQIAKPSGVDRSDLLN